MTLVVDASVVAEVLLGTVRGRVAMGVIGDHELVAPQHLTAEVASVVRGWSLGGHLSEAAALQALGELPQLGIQLLPTEDLLADVFALRHNLTAYDALYVVLARRLGCPLVSLDERLARAAPDCVVTAG